MYLLFCSPKVCFKEDRRPEISWKYGTSPTLLLRGRASGATQRSAYASLMLNLLQLAINFPDHPLVQEIEALRGIANQVHGRCEDDQSPPHRRNRMRTTSSDAASVPGSDVINSDSDSSDLSDPDLEYQGAESMHGSDCASRRAAPSVRSQALLEVPVVVALTAAQASIDTPISAVPS
jgi:hypothetical protein